ncbi:MAG: hypothetical protein ACRC2R_17355 [Xenococcaceae cyanobacterium]
MINLISQAIVGINSFLKIVRVKTFLATVLVGLIVLTSTVNSTGNDRALNNIDDKIFESNPERPTTTREWYQKARETEDSPGERVKEIGKESAQALKEWGSLYPETAQKSAPDILKDN